MTERRIALLLAIVAFVTFAWFYGGAGWNQDAHLALTRAIVERGTLHVDGYVALTGDTSIGRDGRTYINKAPGLSLAAVPPYAAVSAIGRSPRVNAWLVTTLTCATSGALIGAFLYLFLRRDGGATRREAAAVAFIALFGTLIFPYSTVFFAHVPSALFLLLSLHFLRSRPVVAGAMAGVAASFFYLSALGALVLLIASRRGARRFILGAVPFAIALGAYHYACFGSVFTTAVEASDNFTDPNLVLGVFGLPSLEALWGLTGSPSRGLFYSSPVLLASLAGIGIAWRRGQMSQTLAIVIATAVLFLLVVSSFNGWHGGWAFGPRYLIPAVPLLAIPLLFALRAMRGVVIALAIVSATIQFVATSVDPLTPETLQRPISEHLVPLFLHGRWPEATARTLGVSYRRVPKVALQRDAGNLGELHYGRGSRTSVLPIALWMIAGMTFVIRKTKEVDT